MNLKLLPFIALAALSPIAAEPKKPVWVDAKVSAVKIAADPGPKPWDSKTLPMSIPVCKPVEWKDGRWIATIGKPPWTLTVVFDKPAHEYFLWRKKHRRPAVFEGTVRLDPEAGFFRLYLTRGLNFADHRRLKFP